MYTLTVRLLTFNHENYIRRCLDGIILQRVNFKFIVVLNDDCSTDGTFEICKEYSEKNPSMFILEKNTSNNIRINSEKNWKKCFEINAKYIALLEGDDYWTDPYKLQKQIDLMLGNKDVAICFSNYQLLFSDSGRLEEVEITKNKNNFDIIDLIENNPFATCTALFEAKYIHKFPFFLKDLQIGDLAIYLFVLSNSKKSAYVLSEYTGVYRIHNGGIHGKAHLSNDGMIHAYKQRIAFWKIILENKFLFEFSNLINRKIYNDRKILMNHYLINKKWKSILILIILNLFYKIRVYLSNQK